MPVGQRPVQEACVWRDRTHYHEPAGRLQELPVHAASDKGRDHSHGGEKNLHQFSKEPI